MSSSSLNPSKTTRNPLLLYFPLQIFFLAIYLCIFSIVASPSHGSPLCSLELPLLLDVCIQRGPSQTPSCVSKSLIVRSMVWNHGLSIETQEVYPILQISSYNIIDLKVEMLDA